MCYDELRNIAYNVKATNVYETLSIPFDIPECGDGSE